MTKHAYLIMAHNEFDILELLVAALDDARNDIYIHFDAKCKQLPSLELRHSPIYILPERIDVCWGDYSQIETEMSLFDYSHCMQNKTGVEYLYYHLISGVDIPLKNQDYIHDFFSAHQGKEFLGFFQGDLEELRKKVQLFHLFPKSFSKERMLNIKSILRALFCRAQMAIGYKRNKDIKLVRGTNWASLTNDFVEYLLGKKKEICNRFHLSFCADEVYKHTLCWNSEFKQRVYNLCDEAQGCMREINWKVTPEESYLPSFTMEDYGRLKNSPMLFARKFDTSNIDVVKRIISELLCPL